MNRFLTLLLILVVAVAGSAYGSEIYKWVDEDGNVHYGDRPTGDGEGVERLAIQSRSTNAEAVQASIDARRARQEDRATQAADRRAAEEDAAAEQEEQARRQELCATYRERLQKFVQSRRLYRVDDAGERVYLDDSQVSAARADAQAKVEEYCSS